jgi:predicted phage baseplate assembly protein
MSSMMSPAELAAEAEVSMGVATPGFGAGVAAAKEFIGIDLGRLLTPEWPQFNIGYADTTPSTLDTLCLDNAYKGAMKGSWLVIATDEGTEQLYRIESAAESGLAHFAVVGKSTRVTLSGDTAALVTSFWNKLRESAVFLQTEEFPLAERPLPDLLPAGDTTVDLEVALVGDDALPRGRTLMLSGVDPVTGAAVAEVATLVSTARIGGNGDAIRTRLTLESALGCSYRRTSAVVLANVVEGNHGETLLRQASNGALVTEVLGGGDGSLPFQRFVLKQKPLTYVSAPNARGRATTLTVRVDGVRWREVPSLYGVGADERVYIVRHADDGKVTVQFGDGRTGARLPTGAENVTAIYRVGTGLEGVVGPDKLTMLMSRPLGVRDVRNPLASSGAEDPEQLDDARENAPLTVLTLDRVVSLLDYEDFARGFAGIGKAAVTLLWTGETQTVHLTIGLAGGGVPTDQSRPLVDLRGAIDAARHPLRPVVAQGYAARPFSITAGVAVAAEYEGDSVLRDVASALLAHFAFTSRRFAQDVTESETIAVMQAVKGVVYIDLDALAFIGGGAAVDGRLEARPARLEGGTIRAAELLTLTASDIHLTPRTP